MQSPVQAETLFQFRIPEPSRICSPPPPRPLSITRCSIYHSTQRDGQLKLFRRTRVVGTILTNQYNYVTIIKDVVFRTGASKVEVDKQQSTISISRKMPKMDITKLDIVDEVDPRPRPRHRDTHVALRQRWIFFLFPPSRGVLYQSGCRSAALYFFFLF